MPLAPQITNTPSTIVVNSDFTVSSVSNIQDNTTFFASSQPEANAIGDIWFDTSNGNKQYRWDGSAWTSVQDTAIATAAADAAAASAAASAAQSTANGKNKVTYSTLDASGSGTTAGDIWFKYTTGGVIIAQWTWNGSSWVSNTLSNAVIASLDAGKITAGTISVAVTLSAATITGGSIDINSGTFKVTSTGSVTISAGSFDINSGAFKVTSAGVVTISAGSIDINSGTFKVTSAGAVTISSGSLDINSGTFKVTSTGALTATSATITGTVNATSGYLGSASTGWNFSSSGYLYNSGSTTILYPTGGGTLNMYSIITDKIISSAGVQSSAEISTTGNARVTAQGTSGNRCEFTYYNTISLHSISSGYGIDTDWAPNSDNTYNLGQATSAGYGANRRWQRLYSNNTTISTSDVRLKTDISDSPLGLAFINSLRPVNYRWITGRQEVVKDADGNGIIIGETPEGKPIFEMQAIPGQRLHYGFIAQEVKQAVDASGVEDFAGWVKDDLSDPDSTESLSYEQFIAPMAKAIQELSTRVEQLEGK